MKLIAPIAFVACMLSIHVDDAAAQTRHDALFQARPSTGTPQQPPALKSRLTRSGLSSAFVMRTQRDPASRQPQAQSNMRAMAPPANDNCAAATLLTVGATCSPVTGDVATATQSLASILCNGYTGTAEDDVWYRFVANASTATIEVTGNGDFDAVIDLRSGACNGTNIACADATFDGGTEIINATGLVVGTTYRFRVYDWYNVAPATTTFSVCVYNTPAAPPNDECTGAVVESLSVPGSVVINGDNTGATDTEGVGVATAWEAFTITSCANITVNYCGTVGFSQFFINLTDACPFVAVLDSSSTYDCGDGNLAITFDNLAAGTYYIPVYSAPGTSWGPYTIEVSATACGGTTPPNDECSGAIIQNLSVPGNVVVNGDNTGATDSEGVGVATVWEAFTISACANITVNYCGTVGFGQFFINLTDACPFVTVMDSSSTYDCGDGNLAITFDNVPAGTYYIPVYSDPLTAWGPYTIAISATACGSGPANDNCGSVTPVALSAGSTVTFTGDNTGATNTGDAVPGSGLDVGADTTTVWHAFTTTTCTNVAVSYCGTTPAFTPVWVVLATSCPADAIVFYSSIDWTTCGDGNAILSYLNLPAGTYYLPVYGDATNFGPYTIDVTATGCGAAPPNDDCAGAFSLAVNTTCVPTLGNVSNATQSLPGIDCLGAGLGVANDDVWYSFIATTTTHTVIVDGLGAVDGIDAVIEVFSGSCAGLTSVACSDTSFTGDVESLEIPGLTVGATYYVRVYNWYATIPANTTFTICVTGSISTSLSDPLNIIGWELYPNPTDGAITITNAHLEGAALIEIVDATGRIAASHHLRLSSGMSYTLPMDRKLATGSYQVRISTAQGSTSRALMVK